MKRNMKQISKKLISVIVALAIVLSCVAVSLSVFAKGAGYKVSNAAPAIPMYKDKAIDLSDLVIEFEDGTTESGDELDWNDAYGVSARIAGTKLLGANVGKTRFTVTDGNKSTNVWVFVNKQGDNDFTLVNSDFSNPATYDLNDWIGASAGSNKPNDVYTNGQFAMWKGLSQPSISSPKYFNENGDGVLRETLKIGAPNNPGATYATFYKSEVLKDFGDYSVETEIGTVIVNNFGNNEDGAADFKANSPTASSGFMFRASLSDAAWAASYKTVDGGAKALAIGVKSLNLRIRNYGGLMLSAYDANGTVASSPRNYLYGDQANMYYTGSINPADLWLKDPATDVKTNKLTLTPAPQSPNTETLHKVKIELKGTGIKYSMNGNVIFDTIANNDVKGMYTPINPAGVTGHTEDQLEGFSEKAEDLYWKQGYPTTYKTVDTISHADYVKYYEENLQAKKGVFGFTNGAGTITHVYTLKINLGGIDTSNMPPMSDATVARVYEVPANSPAVPLYVGKGIGLNMLNIEIGGTKATGDTLTWTRFSGTAAKIQDGKLVGVSEGEAGFTVSDGAHSQNVWAIVNETGDTDFSLINFDFANGDTYNAADWLTGQFELDAETYKQQANGIGKLDGYKKSGGIFDRGHYAVSTNVSPAQAVPIAQMANPTVKTTTGNKAQGALYIPSNNSYYGAQAAVYKSEMMKDFLDYTITSNLSVKMEGAETEHQIASPGIFARAQINDNAKTGEAIFDEYNKSYLFRFRNYGGLSVFAINSSNIGSHHAEIEAEVPDLTNQWETPYLSFSPGTCYYSMGTGVVGSKNDLLPGASLKENLVMHPDAKSATALTMRNVTIELAGKDIKYSLDGKAIFDTTAKKNFSRNSLNFKVEPGEEPFKIENDSQLAYTSFAGVWDTNINAVRGGSVGLVNNFGEGLYVYTLKVEAKNVLDSEDMPSFEDVDVEINESVPVNTRIDLSKIPGAEGLTFEDELTDEYEIKNNIFVAYYELDGIELTSNEGPSITLDISEAGTSSDYNVSPFAPENIEIITDTEAPGYYMLAISHDYDVSIGSLKLITEDGETKLLDALEEEDGDDAIYYEFECDSMDTAKIVCGFIDEPTAMKELVVLGTQIKTTDDKAIRFKTRLPQIRHCEMYDGTLKFDGADVTYENAGLLIIPTALLSQSAFMITNKDFNPETSEMTAIGSSHARNVLIQNLAVSNAKYSDAWVRLNFSASSTVDQLGVEFSVRPYVQYRTSTGTVGYLYGDIVTNSYNAVLNEME